MTPDFIAAFSPKLGPKQTGESLPISVPTPGAPFRTTRHEQGCAPAPEEVLTQFAAGAGLEEFARRFRGATSAIPYVRHVFSGAGVSNPEAEAIASVKLANLDSAFLGQAYSEDSIVVEYDADHFELLDPQLLKKYTDPILQRLQVAATKRSHEAHS